MSEITIQCKELGKVYREGKLKVEVFQHLDLMVSAGEQVAIIGRSGAGKSTLLHLLGGLDRPTTGQVLIEGEDLYKLSENKRSKLRNQKLGFVYQLHHLLPEFTVLENVAMPLLVQGLPLPEVREQARAILVKVGLENRLQHKTTELSGGERQRTAIARGLVTKPRCLLADQLEEGRLVSV